jgi:hypothetical protein
VTPPPIQASGSAVGLTAGGGVVVRQGGGDATSGTGCGQGQRGGTSEDREEPTSGGGRGGEESHNWRKKAPSREGIAPEGREEPRKKLS